MKIAFHTFGCKVNLVETENLKLKASEEGYEYVPDLEDADIIVINSCAVTDKAEKKTLQYLRRIKSKFPNKKIAVTGCMAELKKDDLGVDFVITNAGKDEIFKYISNRSNFLTPIDTLDHYRENYSTGLMDKTRGFLKIQDGCDEFCSYCIIPFLRGKPRSKPIQNIVDEFSILLQKGFKEIVLVGIHIGKYGLDINSSIYELLLKLTSFEGKYRIRLSSIEINELTDELISLIVNNNNICKHLHIPLQSASDKILQLMGRKYNYEYFIRKIKEIKKLSPFITIGSDIIVGFPGETEEDFSQIYDNIYNSPLDYLHVFPYSKREGTKAANMNNQIDEHTKHYRSEKLRELSDAKKFNSAKKFFGKEIEVLTEKNSKGLTEHYFEVTFLHNNIEPNRFVKTKIVGITFDGNLIGKIIEEVLWV
ncbi:MAG: tRNA (N(6)-L-threonylcarbamoyladenosine(37)-C(2))-methylthiotransferase MtaB [Deferribacterales bacterium]